MGIIKIATFLRRLLKGMGVLFQNRRWLDRLRRIAESQGEAEEREEK